jgi:predicted aspartyl protease
MPISHSFTTVYSGMSNQLINNVTVDAAFDDQGQPIEKIRSKKQWKALWDTGATGSCISQRIAAELGLKPTAMSKMITPSGEKTVPCYRVQILLPNNVRFADVQVLEADCQKFDMLIGMNIIGQGDFAVSNFQGSTVFSYRYPSLAKLDFVQHSYLIPHQAPKEPGRNEKCPCGSGEKYKNCCGKN